MSSTAAEDPAVAVPEHDAPSATKSASSSRPASRTSSAALQKSSRTSSAAIQKKQVTFNASPLYPADVAPLSDQFSATLDLAGEYMGGDDDELGEVEVPRLDDLCVRLIAENFADFPILDEIPLQYVDSVVQQLDPSQIPLTTVAMHVSNEKLWQRMCDRWPNADVANHGSSWKRLYLEQNLQELLESYYPSKDESNWNHLMEIVEASRPFIHSVAAKQFLSHADIAQVLADFPNLSTLNLTYGARDLGMNFDKALFGLKLTDAIFIGKLLMNTRTLNRLVLAENLIDDEKIQLLMGGLAKNDTLTSLELPHNKIGDMGARRIASWLAGNFSQSNDAGFMPTVLMNLNLADNHIRSVGVAHIGTALRHNQTLLELNLRLNRLGDEGGEALLQCLQDNTTLQKLNIAANELGALSARALVEFVRHNECVTTLDVSCNDIMDTRPHLSSAAASSTAGSRSASRLASRSATPALQQQQDDESGPQPGHQFKAALTMNTTIVEVDLRRTGISKTILSDIREVLRPRQVSLRQSRRKLFMAKSWE